MGSLQLMSLRVLARQQAGDFNPPKTLQVDKWRRMDLEMSLIKGIKVNSRLWKKRFDRHSDQISPSFFAVCGGEGESGVMQEQ